MDNIEFGKRLECRTKEFGIRIVKLSGQLPFSPEGKVIRNQISKSGTSVGANYREANRSRSKADFNNKIRICEGEASETIYWLEVISGLNWLDKKETKPVMKEATELCAIFTSIRNKLRSKL